MCEESYNELIRAYLTELRYSKSLIEQYKTIYEKYKESHLKIIAIKDKLKKFKDGSN